MCHSHLPLALSIGVAGLGLALLDSFVLLVWGATSYALVVQMLVVRISLVSFSLRFAVSKHLIV